MKRILVGLDASPRAPFVLATAVDLARRLEARLVLLRTIGLPPEIDQEMSTHAAADLIETMKTRALKEIELLARDVPASLFEAKDVVIGTPWDRICREAAARDVDLVIIGSHGYSGLDRLLGTTAAKVVNHCERSVLVARPSADS